MVALRRIGDEQASESAGDGQQQAFGERLADDVRARGSDGEAEGGLRAAGHAASEEQVGEVGAGNQQDGGADTEEDLEAAAVLFLHFGDAGTTLTLCLGSV